MIATAKVCLVAALTWSGCAGAVQATRPGDATATSAQESYFPVAVGDSWTYRCSVEGRPQLDKTLTVRERVSDVVPPVFRATLEVRPSAGGKPERSELYLRVDGDGFVTKGATRSFEGAERVGATTLRAGMKLGELTVTREQDVSTPATQKRRGWLAQNFDNESPDIPEDRRLSWKSVTFVKGVGPVVEADGLGGECVLTRFHVN